uniref:Uncharacterized protein n=1 Tax=Arundo donax TaxID=35708 RepID=A0A0A9TCN1_ARUDO
MVTQHSSLSKKKVPHLPTRHKSRQS